MLPEVIDITLGNETVRYFRTPHAAAVPDSEPMRVNLNIGHSKPNTLVCVGYLAVMRAYLNMTVDVAIARFLVDEPSYTEEEARGLVKVIHFNDTFGIYDGWEV